MAPGQPPPQIGTDSTALLMVLLVMGIPIVFVIYKICAGLKVEEPRKKKKNKKEEEEDADDPMAWFAGKLNEMAIAREEKKAAKQQEGKGLTPNDLWNMLDANKDGLLSMGEFKKGVQKNESLQYLLFTGKNPDVSTMKAVFRTMHVRRLQRSPSCLRACTTGYHSSC